MITFSQFLEYKFGIGTGHSPAKLVARGAPKPAKPHIPKYVRRSGKDLINSMK